MKVIHKDQEALTRERIDNEKKNRDTEEREKYIESLRKSRKFQKYIVKEMIIEMLDSLCDSRNIPICDDREAMGDALVQSRLSEAAMRKHFSKLL